MYVAKTKTLISCLMYRVQLICASVFARYAKIRFSHEMAQFSY